MQAEPPEIRSDQTDHDLIATANSKSLPKIDGFLIIVAIGLIISLLQNLGILAGALAPFRREHVWERLTTAGSAAYHPYWKPVLLFELVSSSVILSLNVIMVILFFRKQRVFPRVIVAGIPVIFVFMLAGYYLSGLIPAVAESADYENQKYVLIVRFIALHVWIPYFLLSEQVKKTFVR